MLRFLPLLLALSAYAQDEPALKGVDVYRSVQLTPERLEKELGSMIRGYARQRGDSRPAMRKIADAAEARVEAKARTLGAFAYVDLHYGPYVTSAERTAYVTLDLVDAKDRKTRMPFRAAPSGSVPDPDGLLDAWGRYAALGERLAREGALDLSERPACAGFYCVWGSLTPELAELEARFPKGAAEKGAALEKVLKRDADPAKRAAALFVLSYSSDGARAAETMLSALEDPAADVRVAALQVLADIALYHKDVFVDARRLIPALDYPATSERARALGALIGLAENPTYKPQLVEKAGPRLLELLKLQQPSNHDLAFTVLSILSGEAYPRRDYEAWGRWLEQSRSSGPAVSPAKP